MRRIAGEFNQAETTFILQSARADRKLRSVTASGAEVFGAGHNALGAWLWLGEHGEMGPLATWQTFHQEIGQDVLPMAEALGLNRSDILTQPKPRPADTGAAHLMVRVLNAETVDKACPEPGRLLAVLREAQAEGCYIYAFDSNASETAHARFFNPTVGLWETRRREPRLGPWLLILGAKDCLRTTD